MSHFGKWCLVLSLVSQQSLACITGKSPPVSLSGSSFRGVDLRFDDGRYGAALKTDKSELSYDLNLNKWCASELDDKSGSGPKCFASGKQIFLRDKGGPVKGVVETFGRQLFIWSVDQQGKADKTLPYISVRDTSTTHPKLEGSASYYGGLKIISYDKTGSQGQITFSSSAVGEFPTLAVDKPSPIQYFARYRSVDIPGKESNQVLELAGHDYAIEECGKMKVKAHAPSASSRLNPAEVATATRD